MADLFDVLNDQATPVARAARPCAGCARNVTANEPKMQARGFTNCADGPVWRYIGAQSRCWHGVLDGDA